MSELETIPTKILLVEDNPGDARLIKEMLAEAEAQDFSLELVTRLADGLERLGRGGIDLVLLDLGLPDSRGLETLTKAYSHYPRVPFVVLTGLADETVGFAAVRQGAQDYLIKGEVDGKLLLRAIRYATERKKIELALEAERKKLFSVLNSLPAFVHLKKSDFSIQFANRRFTEIFGEPGNRRCYEVLTGKSSPCEHCQAFEVLTTKTPQKLEWTSSNAQTYEVYNYPFCYKDELLVLTLGIDITERQQAEEALRETRNYLENLIDFANAPIIVWDPEFKITRFNHAFENLTGYPAAEVLGQKLDMLFPEASREESLTRIAQTLGGEYWESVEIPILRKDGDVRIALWNSANISAEDGKTLLATIAQGQDITERQQAEEALRESEERFRTIFEGAAMGISLRDVKGGLISCNPAYQKMFGYGEEELKGKGFLVHPDEEEKVLELYQEMVNGMLDRGQAEVRCRHKNGNYFWGRVTYSLANEHQSEPSYCICMVEDITGHKEAEESIHYLTHELMRTQEKEKHKISLELHDTVAQELAALKLCLENFEGDLPKKAIPELSSRVAEYSAMVKKAVHSIRTLSYDLRPPDLEHFGLVQAIKLHCEEFAARNGITVDFRAAGMEAVPLSYDVAINLYRIVQEGLTNVWRHAQAINVRIRLVASFPKIILRMEDDGQGFDVSSQKPSTTQEKHMGLLGIRERVALLRGKMSIESQLMRGTKINVEIPWSGEGLDSKEKAHHC